MIEAVIEDRWSPARWHGRARRSAVMNELRDFMFERIYRRPAGASSRNAPWSCFAGVMDHHPSIPTRSRPAYRRHGCIPGHPGRRLRGRHDRPLRARRVCAGVRDRCRRGNRAARRLDRDAVCGARQHRLPPSGSAPRLHRLRLPLPFRYFARTIVRITARARLASWFAPRPEAPREVEETALVHVPNVGARSGRRRFLTLAVALVTLSLVMPAGALAAKPPITPPHAVNVQLLAINDFHGNLEPPSGSGGRVGAPLTDRAACTAADRELRFRRRRRVPRR